MLQRALFALQSFQLLKPLWSPSALRPKPCRSFSSLLSIRQFSVCCYLAISKFLVCQKDFSQFSCPASSLLYTTGGIHLPSTLQRHSEEFSQLSYSAPSHAVSELSVVRTGRQMWLYSLTRAPWGLIQQTYHIHC